MPVSEPSPDRNDAVVEFQIPVQWGHIAGVKWGIGEPLLLLHGILDNCNSFTFIRPYLPTKYSCVAIDFPGHGKSSPFPVGLPLLLEDFAYTILRVLQHLGWEKCTIIGHSFGAIVAVLFSACFPHRSVKLILIDGAFPYQVDSNLLSKEQAYLKRLSLISPQPNRVYSFEEMLIKLKNRHSSLSENAARSLLERNSIPSGKGCIPSTDPRLRIAAMGYFSSKQAIEISKNVKCPILVIASKESHISPDKVYGKHLRTGLQILCVYAPNVKFVFVSGNHNVHMNNPETVAPLLCQFLLKSSI